MPGRSSPKDPTPTERRMKKLLADWKRSGLSMVVFCRRQGVPPQRLQWWKSEIGRRARRRKDDSSQRPAPLIQLPITPLDLPLASSAQDRITVELPGGLRVHCPRDFSAAELREVLEAVRSSC